MTERFALRTWSLAAILGAALGVSTLPAVGAAAAQEPAREAGPRRTVSEPPLFPRLFRQPTGRNGCEELLQAADALRGSTAFARAEPDGAALALKRGALRDRSVTRALLLLRQGLSKAVIALPAADPAAEALPAELPAFRRLGRLLHLEQYVLLADGRTPEAIQVARLGLRLGRVVQSGSLVHGLTGLAVGTLGLRTLAERLDQLGARDCELLHQVCLEWLAQPPPLPRVLEGEQRLGRHRLAALQSQLGEAAVPALTRAVRRLEEFYAEAMVETRKPAWQRAPLAVEADGDPYTPLVAALVPAVERALDSFTREEAQVRLLACHALVLRYRWEQDRLPTGLEEAGAGSLAVDPFTGSPLKYEVLGLRRYRLVSAGPRAAANDPQAVDGRRPVSIGPEPP